MYLTGSFTKGELGDDVKGRARYPFNVGTMGIGMIGDYRRHRRTAQQSLIDLISREESQRG